VDAAHSNENAHVEALKEKMVCNLHIAKENLENAEKLEKMSEECLKEAKIFRKRTKALPPRRRRAVITVTVSAAVVGGTIALMAGGPSAPAVIHIANAAAAQGIETIIGTVVCGTLGYGFSDRLVNAWFWAHNRILI